MFFLCLCYFVDADRIWLYILLNGQQFVLEMSIIYYSMFNVYFEQISTNFSQHRPVGCIIRSKYTLFLYTSLRHIKKECIFCYFVFKKKSQRLINAA